MEIQCIFNATGKNALGKIIFFWLNVCCIWCFSSLFFRSIGNQVWISVKHKSKSSYNQFFFSCIKYYINVLNRIIMEFFRSIEYTWTFAMQITQDQWNTSLTRYEWVWSRIGIITCHSSKTHFLFFGHINISLQGF